MLLPIQNCQCHMLKIFSSSPLVFRSLLNCVASFHQTGLPRRCNGKEPARQCRRHKRHGFDPWVRKIPWRRKWQPTPGKVHGQRSLVGYGPWGHKESDVTECAATRSHLWFCCLAASLAPPPAWAPEGLLGAPWPCGDSTKATTSPTSGRAAVQRSQV